MAKTIKKSAEDLKQWLLDFEAKVGKGVVVSLLIEDGNIDFISVVDRSRYLGIDNDSEGEEPSIDLKESKKKVEPYALNVKNYIG
jgi:hypothetical protein